MNAMRNFARAVRTNGIVAALLVGLLGFALTTQLRRDEGSEFDSAREGDLVRILDELEGRRERLRIEISDVNDRLDAVTSQKLGAQAAVTEARRRADELAIFAGTVPVRGPGVLLTLRKDSKVPDANRVLDAVQELRGAGAEGMQISGASGETVRIVVSTYFVAADGGAIEVDGKTVTAPFVITAIGDPPTIKAALEIPGGVVDTIKRAGGRAKIEEHEDVTVDAVAVSQAPRYAKPAP